MKCKAECPNTDVCEHGYCPPHRYSYCERKLTPTPMNDTQPTGLDLDDILDDWLVHDESCPTSWSGIGPDKCDCIAGKQKQHIKADLTRWGLEQQNEALERFRVFCYEKHAFEAWDTPQSNRQGWLDTKLREFAELQANLQDGGEDG